MQKWKQWIPREDIQGLMIGIETVISSNCLTLTYVSHDDSKKIFFNFKKGFLSLRNTEEGSFEKAFDGLISYKADKDAKKRAQWLLFKVENSDYVRLFKQEAMGVYDNAHITHYVIISYDLVTEILSLIPPKVEIIEKE